MKTHNIPLEAFRPKSGTKLRINDNGLHIPAEESNTGKSRNYAYVPGEYKLPFRIDMTVKTRFIEVQPEQFTWYIGKGRVYFNGGRICCSDIFAGGKGVIDDNGSPYHLYYSALPEKDFVNVSVVFGSKVMWVCVDNKYCYASDKFPYIKSMQENSAPNDRLDISLCCGTHTQAVVKSLVITEYENDEPDIPAKIRNLPELSPFELYVKGLPPGVHDEVFRTDEFLLNDMKGSLKFKRVIDNCGHLTYKSPCGLQYQIREFGVHGHQTNWIQSLNKPDYTNEIFKKLAETSPEFAEKMFSKLQVCNPHARECNRRTTVELNGKSIQVCSSTIRFELLSSEFEDLRKVVAAASEVMKTINTKKQ